MEPGLRSYDDEQFETTDRWAELPKGKIIHLKPGETPPRERVSVLLAILPVPAESLGEAPSTISWESPALGASPETRWTNSQARSDRPDGTGKRSRQKRYLDEMPGVVVQDIWTDLNPIGAQAPSDSDTRPRNLRRSSNESSRRKQSRRYLPRPLLWLRDDDRGGAALGRRWIGIDVTYLAIGLVERRMKDTFGPEVAGNWKVVGEPRTVADAGELARRDRYQFQWWALDRVDARPKESTEEGGGSGRGRNHQFPGVARRGGPHRLTSGQNPARSIATMSRRSRVTWSERTPKSASCSLSKNLPSR